MDPSMKGVGSELSNIAGMLFNIKVGKVVQVIAVSTSYSHCDAHCKSIL
jgi:hypothetical protein